MVVIVLHIGTTSTTIVGQEIRIKNLRILYKVRINQSMQCNQCKTIIKSNQSIVRIKKKGISTNVTVYNYCTFILQ